MTLFYQIAIKHVYFYEIEFAKYIIRYRIELIVLSFTSVNSDLVDNVLKSRECKNS